MIPLAANNKKMEWIQSIQINKHKQQCVSKSVAKKRTSKGTNHSNRQDLCQSKPFQNYTNVANSRFPCNSHSTVTWSEVITQYKNQRALSILCRFYAHINPWKYLIYKLTSHTDAALQVPFPLQSFGQRASAVPTKAIASMKTFIYFAAQVMVTIWQWLLCLDYQLSLKKIAKTSLQTAHSIATNHTLKQ